MARKGKFGKGKILTLPVLALAGVVGYLVLRKPPVQAQPPAQEPVPPVTDPFGLGARAQVRRESGADAVFERAADGWWFELTKTFGTYEAYPTTAKMAKDPENVVLRIDYQDKVFVPGEHSDFALPVDYPLADLPA